MKTLGKALLISGVAILTLGAVVAIPIAIKNSQKSSVVVSNKNTTSLVSSTSTQSTTSISGSTSETTSSSSSSETVNPYNTDSGFIDGKYYLPFDHRSARLYYERDAEDGYYEWDSIDPSQSVLSPVDSQYFLDENNALNLAITTIESDDFLQIKVEFPLLFSMDEFSSDNIMLAINNCVTNNIVEIRFGFDPNNLPYSTKMDQYILPNIFLVIDSSSLSSGEPIRISRINYAGATFDLENFLRAYGFSLADLLEYVNSYSIVLSPNSSIQFTQPYVYSN